MKKAVALSLLALLLAALPASAARPTVALMAKDEIGTPIALDNGEAEPGETMAFRFDVTNNNDFPADFRVEISTPDPYGQPVSGYTWTDLTVSNGATVTTGAGLLRMKVSQQAACGYRVPLVVRVYNKALSTEETFETYGIFVSEPVATAVPSRVGPLTLGAPDYQVSFAPRSDATPGMGMFWNDGTQSQGRFLGVDGARSGITSFGNTAASGDTLAAARGSDGWGMAYDRGGVVYFRKSLDAGSLSSEVTVATGTSPRICFDPVVGWIVTYSVSAGGGLYNLFARRVRDDSYAVSSALTVASGIRWTGHARLVNGYSAGTAPDRYSQFVHYEAGDNGDPLVAYRFYFREPASAAAPGAYSPVTVETIPAGWRVDQIEVVPSLGTADGRYHHVVYMRSDWASTGGYDLRVRRVDSFNGALGTPTAILSGVDGVQYHAAPRANLNELSVVYTLAGESVQRRLYQVNVAGEPPVPGTPREVYDGEYPSYKAGDQLANVWVSGGRDVVYFAAAQADDWHWMSVQDANPNAFETPMAQEEARITDTAIPGPVAAAAVGGRVGVIWASIHDDGVNFQIFDRTGTALVPRKLLDPWSTGSAIGKVALASDGTDFLAIWQKPADPLYSYAILDGDDGSVKFGPATIPLRVGTRSPAASPLPVAAFTGRTYRYVIAERDATNAYYVTTTIRRDGTLDSGNMAELGSHAAVTSPTPALGCNGFDQCAVAFATTLRTQTGSASTWNGAQTLPSNATAVASDGGTFLVLAGGTMYRRWLDGTARSTGASGVGTAGNLVFKGDGYLVHRYVGNQTINSIQTFDTAGNAVTGAHPNGLFPAGTEWGPDAPIVSGTALVWLPSGEAILVFNKRRIWEQGLYDLHLTRLSLPAAYLPACTAIANTPALVASIPAVTVYIRDNAAPPPSHVLTDAFHTAAVTFRGGAGNAAWDAEFGGRIVEAGWDFDADGTIDVPVADTNGNGAISQAESEVTIPSADLVRYGFPVDSLDCACQVRFYARDQVAGSGWSYQTLAVTLVDDSHPTVNLLVPDGGEAWPGGTTQTIAWDADDNVGLGSFDLHYEVAAGTELVFEPTSTLPQSIADGGTEVVEFFVPGSFPVADVSLDVDLRWGGVENSVTVTLENVGSVTSVILNGAGDPLANFSSVVGN